MFAMVSEEILNEIILRIVKTAHPLKIILFGSAQRGEMGPNSDLDILVVVPWNRLLRLRTKKP